MNRSPVSPWRRLALLAALVTVFLGLSGVAERPAASAQDRAGPAGAPLPADLALVPPDAFGFVHVKVSELWQGEVGKTFRQLFTKEFGPALQDVEKHLGLAVDDLDRATVMMLSPKEPAPLAILTAGKPLARAKVLAALVPEAQEHQYKGKTYFTSKQEGRPAVHFVDDKTLLLGQAEDVVQLLKRLTEARREGPLGPALRYAAGKHHVTAGLVVPEEVVEKLRNVPEDQLRNRPLELALLETVRPLSAARSVAFTADLGAATDFRVDLIFPDEKSAKEAEWPAKDMVAAGRILLRVATSQLAREPGAANLVPFLKELETALRTVSVEVKGARLQASAHFKTDAATLAKAGRSLVEATVQIQKSAGRMQSANNLKQIALAMHNYHDTHGSLPPHAIYKDGKPLLSWRVAILPYVEQDALYQQFRLDEPWDSEHNKALLQQMPPVYAPVRVKPKGPGLTYYQVFVGKSAVFEGKEGTRLADITDGTSNTLLVAEAAEPVPWTKPDDLAFDPTKPLPKLGGLFEEGFNAALCDGSVRFISKKIAEETLRALITRNGGEVINFDEVK